MEVLHTRCAGLDVHKDSVVACARIVKAGRVEQFVETFGTTTSALLGLSDWLSGHEVTHVAMEATGVYWRPVWHVLEGGFELVLANAGHVKNVPGRKTDVNDAMWIADLLAHGLIRGSFVPPTAVQDLRALTRTRKQLVREKAQHIQRIQKVLEDANVKLSSVVSDITGQSARAILKGLATGETDPEKLASLVSTKLRATRQQIIEAVRGHVRKHHQFLLRLHLDQIDTLDRAIASIEEEVGDQLDPFRAAAANLTTIHGISDTVAHVVVAEIGIDMSRFPTAAHLISWATLCPGNDESAGKRRSSKLRKGAKWLKSTLVQAAWAAIKTKDSYFRAKFHRLKARRGPKKAIVAIAASMLRAAYYMLRDGVSYRDLGGDHYSNLDRTRTANRLVKRLAALGYSVDIRAPA